jgi:hypothetical protein
MDLIDLMEEQAIIEKQNRLLSEPNNDRFSYSQVKARAAKRDAHIDDLLRRYSPSDVEYILEGLTSPCHIRARAAKIKLERETTSTSDIDIITGEAFSTGGYVGILQP